MKKIYASFLCFCLSFGILSAVQAQSVHEEELNRYRQYDFATDAEYDQLFGRDTKALRKIFQDRQTKRRTGEPLGKKVFGWHPYWLGETWNTYDFSNLNTIAWFSYEVNPTTGGYSTIRNWNTTKLIEAAHAAGVKVVLTVTLFGASGNATLLNNPTARQNLINNLITVVKSRGGDGVNIDFESVATAEKEELTQFMNDVSERFHAEIPGSRVSIALPALASKAAYDVAAMTKVDDFLIMGYDYWYSGSPTAGPVAPLAPSSFAFWGPTLNLTKSVDDYLAKGIPASKLFLAIPFYGRRWATTNNTIGANSVTENSKVASASRTYAAAKEEIATKGYTRQWNAEGAAPYYVYQENGQWFQTFYEDVQSLGMKMDLINSRNLAGMGIWALGYDNPSVNPEVNTLIRSKFPPNALAASNELEVETNGSAYPNPVARGQKVYLRQTKSITGVALHDAVGKTYKVTLMPADGSLSTETLKAGLYFLTVKTAKGSATNRVVVVE
ncbi:MAG: glycosyl hydrolase family 18 protein [Rufibacter sp.]